MAIHAWTVGCGAAKATIVQSTLRPGGDGLYSNPQNWSPAEVPNNSAGKEFSVNVPFGITLDIDVVVSQLTLHAGMFLEGHSCTVIGATTTKTAGNIFYWDLFFASSSPAATTFSTGSLSAFSHGTLNGNFYLSQYAAGDGWATLQFTGADVIKLSAADVSLIGPRTRIIDETGANALRNLAWIDSASRFTLAGQQLAVPGNFRNDGAITIVSGFNQPARFTVNGPLTNFDARTRTLRNGTYYLGGDWIGGSNGGSTFQFSGADIVNNGATLGFTGAQSGITDENGHDALRNLTRNLPSGHLRFGQKNFAVPTNFQNDGLLEIQDNASFVVPGKLANFDPSTKTLSGGDFRISGGFLGPARFSFHGADIVSSRASISLSGNQSAITDENGNDALRNFKNNEAGGAFSIGADAQFRAASDFSNAGTVAVSSLSGGFLVIAPHFYRQSAGETAIYGGFTGNMQINGGSLVGGPADLDGASGAIFGNVTVGAATVRAAPLYVKGSVRFSRETIFHFEAVESLAGEGLAVGGLFQVDGILQIQPPNRFPIASDAVFVIAQATRLTGVFANAPNGSRVTTTDGRGSFVVRYTQTEITLSDYRRSIPPAQLLNISTRAQVLGGDRVEIGGFIISGQSAKTVVVRAIGPSLAGFGVSAPLTDPVLELHDSAGALVATNDNWADTQAQEIEASGLAPKNARESAILAQLSPGAYTAIVRGKNGSTGVALMEVYDVAPSQSSKLANISTRGFVNANQVLIGGLIGGGSGTGNLELVVRALGQELQMFGVTEVLADPMLEVRDQNGTLIAANDDFGTPRKNRATVPDEFSVGEQREAETGLTLRPGNYTVIVRAKGNASGIALVEIYDLNR